MIERHSILRTSFHLEEYGEPVQIVHRYVGEGGYDIKEERLEGLSREQQGDYIGEFMKRDRGEV
ncbi:hypothetical protein, partial [Tolypothrix sp. VBCCA 56010]|uniref:hypothetical protein n=1 Tax=Tolypothrix sp. VBCCA 56010 TaxID=3137731 RepID=UPI003D7DFE4E